MTLTGGWQGMAQWIAIQEYEQSCMTLGTSYLGNYGTMVYYGHAGFVVLVEVPLLPNRLFVTHHQCGKGL